ncbi:MAG: metalloregulator ArsR/SmtB family transcription factor [Patescibacteria group bacterium]
MNHIKEKEMEKILKALANRRRLAILAYLKKNGEATVGNIAKKINLSFKATSKHLGILSAVNIVDKNQRRLQMFYYLSVSQKPLVKYTINLL